MSNLKGAEVLSLPTDYSRSAVQQTAGRRHQFELNGRVTVKLKELAKEQGTTLFMVVLSMYKILLSKYSSRSDITVGIPVANRGQAELNSLIGFFVNTLAIRSEVDENISYLEFLAELKERMIAGYERQEVPFEQVVDKVETNRDLSRSPVISNHVYLAKQR